MVRESNLRIRTFPFKRVQNIVVESIGCFATESETCYDLCAYTLIYVWRYKYIFINRESLNVFVYIICVDYEVSAFSNNIIQFK